MRGFESDRVHIRTYGFFLAYTFIIISGKRESVS